MKSSSREIWVSPRSWLLSANSELVRPGPGKSLLGLGRQGDPAPGEIDLSRPSASPRRMFELFTSHGYAIVDEASAIVTLSGPVSVKEVVSSEAWRTKLTIEEFMGEILLPDWNETLYSAAPHGEYLPETIGRRVMALALSRTGQDPYVISRPLFGCSQWLLRHLSRTWKSGVALQVDNRTFPCEMSVTPGERGACQILATSSFVEPSPVRLTVSDSQWNLVCDGLVIG